MNADADLEQVLRDLGDQIEWPDATHISEVVGREIAMHRHPRRSRWQPRRLAVAALLVFAIALGGIAAWPSARETVADRLGVPGIEISRESQRAPAGSTLQLGEHVMLGDAQERAGFAISAPPQSLGTPDVYVLSPDWGTQVSFAFHPTATLPEVGDSGVGLLISELQGSTTDSFIRKFLDEGTTMEVVEVRGEVGYWIAGSPHAFVYTAPDDSFHQEDMRLAGNVLLWTAGDVTYRIESMLPRDAVIQIAQQLGPVGDESGNHPTEREKRSIASVSSVRTTSVSFSSAFTTQPRM